MPNNGKFMPNPMDANSFVNKLRKRPLMSDEALANLMSDAHAANLRVVQTFMTNMKPEIEYAATARNVDLGNGVKAVAKVLKTGGFVNRANAETFAKAISYAGYLNFVVNKQLETRELLVHYAAVEAGTTSAEAPDSEYDDEDTFE